MNPWNMVLSAALLGVWGAAAQAQPKPFPQQPIKLVVGYSPGGSVDIVARQYGQKLSELLGQSVIVENKAGASGTLAANAVKNAAPNGYTLYFVASPTISITPAVTTTSFDPVADFSPIGSVVKYTNVLLVGAQSPFKTLPDLVAFGKAQPGQLTYASAGNGSSNHLSGVLLAKYAGITMTHVPLKNVFTISTQPRWSAIGMSSKGWSATCTGVQARASAQKSPDFTPTRRDSGFAGGLRRCKSSQ